MRKGKRSFDFLFWISSITTTLLPLSIGVYAPCFVPCPFPFITLLSTLLPSPYEMIICEMARIDFKIGLVIRWGECLNYFNGTRFSRRNPMYWFVCGFYCEGCISCNESKAYTESNHIVNENPRAVNQPRNCKRLLSTSLPSTDNGIT
ncbi:uncharacterized protein BDW43DRAFT_104350 [Aspergillus alliaceus]|uniref:uncharacterized protein n=1 Tax=Petromyces alliaceus TaxID=209559 RepID=UPI0012A73906|nr:uncharacterized protein BDW43DRAFT_104350 [Aspergillus alliaceus]KAB8232804.1 hypothetical protein BDW43DRAFT_104350 [Aspergillus alliaceus]